MPKMTLGERFKAARARTDHTQESVGEAINVHHFTYAKWEQDLHPPGKRSLYDDVARLFNCSVTWLRDGTGEIGYYAPEYASDQQRRRDVTRRARLRPDAAAGSSAGVNGISWPLVANCAVLLVQANPDADLTALARALPLFYAMAARSPELCDLPMASQILQTMG